MTTASEKIARAARIVASCSSSFDPKCANSPLLLIESSWASRPIVTPSSPSTDARSTARRSTVRRVSSPRRIRPSVTVASDWSMWCELPEKWVAFCGE